MGGDLYLEIEFQPHRLYRAENRDIYLNLPITPWEAALGCTVVVPTLGGKVTMKIPAGSYVGDKSPTTNLAHRSFVVGDLSPNAPA